jgi:integrase
VAREIRSHIGKLVPFAQASSGSFNAAVKRHSGVKRFHVHQLRHTFACRYLEAGGALMACKEILGHQDIDTTLGYAALAEALVQRDAAYVQEQQAARGL